MNAPFPAPHKIQAGDALRRTGLRCLAALLLFPAPGLFAQNLTTGQELFWNMDEGSGTTLTDRSGNGHTGTLNGGVLWTNGLSGNGAQFTSNGGAPWILGTLGSGVMQNGSETSNWSIAIWFRTDRCNGNTGGFLWGRYGYHAGLTLASNGGNPKLTCNLLLSTGTAVSLWATGSFLDQAWHLAVVTYSNRAVALYVDGAPKASTNLAATQMFYNHSTAIYLGSMTGNYANPYLGSLDEFRVWSRSLSPEDIQALMTPGLALTNGLFAPASASTSTGSGANVTLFSGTVFLSPGTALAGTCTANPADARLVISNKTSEITNLMLALNGTGGWTADPALPLGTYRATLHLSNGGGQTATLVLPSLTVAHLGSLTIQCRNQDGANLGHTALTTPFGVFTNDGSGLLYIPQIPLDVSLGFSNHAPSVWGWPIAVTNMTVRGTNTVVSWSIPMPRLSTLTVRTRTATGNPLPGRITGPGGLRGIRTNDALGRATFTPILEGATVALSNYPSGRSSALPAMTNLVMPAGDLSIDWILESPMDVFPSETRQAISSVWTPGRPLVLPVFTEDVGILTVKLVPLAGGRSLSIHQGFVVPGQSPLSLPLDHLSLTPGVWVLEWRLHRQGMDEGLLPTSRRLLLIAR